MSMCSRRTASSPEMFEIETDSIKYIGSAVLPQLHKEIKSAARREGISISLFLRRACVERLRKIEAHNEQ